MDKPIKARSKSNIFMESSSLLQENNSALPRECGKSTKHSLLSDKSSLKSNLEKCQRVTRKRPSGSILEFKKRKESVRKSKALKNLLTTKALAKKNISARNHGETASPITNEQLSGTSGSVADSATSTEIPSTCELSAWMEKTLNNLDRISRFLLRSHVIAYLPGDFYTGSKLSTLPESDSPFEMVDAKETMRSSAGGEIITPQTSTQPMDTLSVGVTQADAITYEDGHPTRYTSFSGRYHA